MTQKKETFWSTVSQPVCPALSGVNMDGGQVGMAMRSAWRGAGSAVGSLHLHPGPTCWGKELQ